MKAEDLESLRSEMREGFQTVNAQLGRLDDGLQAANARLQGLETTVAGLDGGLQTLTAKVDDGFADMHQALHGLMFKLLTPSEINEIRSQMKSPPEMKTFPFWAIR